MPGYGQLLAAPGTCLQSAVGTITLPGVSRSLENKHFTQAPRSRRIPGSPYGASCVTPPLCRLRMAYCPTRVSVGDPYISVMRIKIQLDAQGEGRASGEVRWPGEGEGSHKTV